MDNVDMLQVGKMKYFFLHVAIYELDGKFWIPLSDIGQGLGYFESANFYRMIRRNSRLLRQKGRILDVDSLSTADSQQARKVTPIGCRDRLFADYAGLCMILMLVDTPQADEFKEWAVERLVPAMVKKARKATPLDDLPPAERVIYLKEHAEARNLEAKRLVATVPPRAAKQLLQYARTCHALGVPGTQELVDSAKRLVDNLNKQLEMNSIFGEGGLA